MLPPVLELYVVWHPSDSKGAEIAKEFFEHFYGSAFTGLIGEAVEVFVRSQGWRSDDDAPRPIPSEQDPLPNGVEPAQFVAIVPLMGTEMAAQVESGAGPWHGYIEKMLQMAEETPERVGIFPCLIDPGAANGTVLGVLLNPYQRIAASPPDSDGESEKTLRCRDLAQGVAQILSEEEGRITVFISHTKRNLPAPAEETAELIALVRQVIANTHLREFFDASAIQPGGDWEAELRTKAATSALVAIRTDLYSSREWCQREILLAKNAGMPIVTMDALQIGEERGSFLMDHVPRILVRTTQDGWSKQNIYQALNRLVDECLKRVLWIHQEELSRNMPGLDIAWWAPHAPEPLTLVHWLKEAEQAGILPEEDTDIRILHPAPPLGPDEELVLQQLLALCRQKGTLDIMTPRLLAARGG